MTAKMDDKDLLALLAGKEEQSSSYVHGQLAGQREQAMREYFREPYGNEEEGWSTIVTSEVQDAVEWIMPDLLDIFSSTEQVVTFDPTRADEVKGAKEATDGCNHVFFKQNNGFLILYTAFKDALLVKNCAVMWRRHEQETPRTETYRKMTADQLAYILEQGGGEIVQASEQPMVGPHPITGQPVPMVDEMGAPVMLIDAKIKTIEKRKTVKVEAFEPENLLVQRNWTSPLLQDCPYVCRLMEVTLSDIHEMGYKDVAAEDLGGGSDAEMSADATYRANRTGQGKREELHNEDESQNTGWLRIEFVLVDRDGDGIAERLCVYRLRDKILKVEEVSHVQIATASPILISHRWDGLSLSEVVSDLQQLKTEITRQTLNSLYLANNPRTGVLTDANWSPMANLDDLLDSRPGGIVREKSANAARELIVPFVGAQSFPMLEYVDQMAQKRTGINDQQQGINPNALQKDRTLGEAQIQNTAAKQRIKLIARIMAEVLVKPIYQGILKLLTDGGMDKLAMKLGNEFVELDPEEWRDQYNMTANVLADGDKKQQLAVLESVLQHQVSGMQMGLADPSKIYHTLKKLTENAGFKNVSDFWIDPKTAQPKAPEVPLPVQIEQAKLQAQGQIKQMELQHKGQMEQLQMNQDAALERMRAEYQAMVDQNRQRSEAEQQQAKITMEAQLEQVKAHYKDMEHGREMTFARWKAELEAATKIEVANIGSKSKLQNAATDAATGEIAREVTAGPEDALVEQGKPESTSLAAAIEGLSAAVAKMGGPRKIVRDQMGRAQGIE